MQLAPYLVLVVPPALVGIYAFASTLAGLARLRRLADQEPVLARWPRVTVVSPACNEARHVEAAVRSTLALDYPELALVAVNDRCMLNCWSAPRRRAKGRSASSPVVSRSRPMWVRIISSVD